MNCALADSKRDGSGRNSTRRPTAGLGFSGKVWQKAQTAFKLTVHITNRRDDTDAIGITSRSAAGRALVDAP
jgi:hypothetical protein